MFLHQSMLDHIFLPVAEALFKRGAPEGREHVVWQYLAQYTLKIQINRKSVKYYKHNMMGVLIRGLPDLSEDACPVFKKAPTMYFKVKSDFVSHMGPASHRGPPARGRWQNGGRDLDAGVSESACTCRRDAQAIPSPSLVVSIFFFFLVVSILICDIKARGSECHLLCWGELGLAVWC